MRLRLQSVQEFSESLLAGRVAGFVSPQTMTSTKRKANIRLAIIIGMLAVGIYVGFIILNSR